MFTIKYVRPDDASGKVATVYDAFPAKVGVPAPVQLYSASEPYLLHQMGFLKRFMANERFEPALLAALRYLGASVSCFDYCTGFNAALLKQLGLSEAELEGLAGEPEQAFDAHNAALVRFVAKAVREPDAVTEADVDAARAAGWSDQEIFEATAYAAQMATVGIVFRAFAA